MTNKRMTITGNNVHDVVYRLFLLDNAERMLITHLDARNSKKGLDIEEVEVLIGGDANRVNKFVEFVQNNFPESADVNHPVDNAENYEEDIRTIESFSRCLSVHQLVKFANIGTKIVIGQDKLRTETNNNLKLLRNETNNNFDRMDKNFDRMDTKYDTISKGMFDTVKEMKKTNELFEKEIKDTNMRMEKTEKSIEELLKILAKK